MPSQYPTALDTTTTLSTAVNGLSTVLNGDHTSGATTITVASTSGAATAGFVTIDSEVIRYTGLTPTTLTGCTRGADSTAAASHSNGSTVKFGLVADHHNSLVTGLIAVQTKLGLNTNGASASSIDAAQLAAGSNASIASLTLSGSATISGTVNAGTGFRDTRSTIVAANVPVLLGTVTLGAGVTTFNIPSSTAWNTLILYYRDVVNSSATTDNIVLRFNGDTTTANYYATTWDTTNSAATITVSQGSGIPGIAWTCLAAPTGSVYAGAGVTSILGANSTFTKQVFTSTRWGNNASNQVSQRFGTWFGGGAITSLGFLSNTGNSFTGIIYVYGYP